MNYSYKGIGEITASFGVKDDAKLAADVPVGIVSACRAGCAAVQLGGIAEVTCSGAAPAPGFVKLVADGNGGLCAGTGREYLVLAAENGNAVIML